MSEQGAAVSSRPRLLRSAPRGSERRIYMSICRYIIINVYIYTEPWGGVCRAAVPRQDALLVHVHTGSILQRDRQTNRVDGRTQVRTDGWEPG